MAEYQTYWNSKQETLSAKEYRFDQENAFLNELNYVWKNSAFYLQKFTETGLELKAGLGSDHGERFSSEASTGWKPVASNLVV